jgi:hypothetical protein
MPNHTTLGTLQNYTIHVFLPDHSTTKHPHRTNLQPHACLSSASHAFTALLATHWPPWPPAVPSHAGQHKATPLQLNTPPIDLLLSPRMFSLVLFCCSPDTWDPLSLSPAAASKRKPWESGFVGCRAARGCHPMLRYRTCTLYIKQVSPKTAQSHSPSDLTGGLVHHTTISICTADVPVLYAGNAAVIR